MSPPADGETPDHYEGGGATFLRDAERVFKSVAWRLQTITPFQALDQD